MNSAAEELQLAINHVERNLEGWYFLGQTPPPSGEETEALIHIKAQRCEAFAKCSMLFWPHMRCNTCETVSSKEHFDAGEFDFSDDLEEIRVPCPVCQELSSISIQCTALKMEDGVPLPYKKQILNKELKGEDVELLKLKDFQQISAGGFVEIVGMLGKKQLNRCFIELAMCTPLLLINSVELIKQQPQLAYNIAMHYDDFQEGVNEMRMFAVTILSVADQNNYRETNAAKMSVCDFLPPGVHMENQYTIMEAKEREEEGEKTRGDNGAEYVHLKHADFEEAKSDDSACLFGSLPASEDEEEEEEEEEEARAESSGCCVSEEELDDNVTATLAGLAIAEKEKEAAAASVEAKENSWPPKQCTYCAMLEVAGPVALGFCQCVRMPEKTGNYKDALLIETYTNLLAKGIPPEHKSYSQHLSDSWNVITERNPPRDGVEKAIWLALDAMLKQGVFPAAPPRMAARFHSSADHSRPSYFDQISAAMIDKALENRNINAGRCVDTDYLVEMLAKVAIQLPPKTIEECAELLCLENAIKDSNILSAHGFGNNASEAKSEAPSSSAGKLD